MKGNWIGFRTEKGNDYTKYGAPSPLFKKIFQVEEGFKTVSLKISSFGVYSFFINGRIVTNDCLLPVWTDFGKRLFYYEYDLTPYVACGDNSFCVILGDGYYCGNIAWVGRDNYGTYPMKFCSELSVNYENKTVFFLSDDSFKATKSYVIASDIINGEKQDGRLKNEDLFLPNYSFGKWFDVKSFCNVKVNPQPANCEPIRKCERFDGVRISNGNIFDFGQNFAGVVRLELEGKEGDEVVVKHGEMLDTDGSLYTDNLRSALARDEYICAGGKEIFEPLFTYHGFRYIEIICPSSVKILKAVGVAVHSDIRFNGRFECSDKNVNKLFSNTVWSAKSNFVGIPTDCPQRDERLGWTGDAQIFCETAMYISDCKRFLEKYLDDIRDAQYEDGMIDSVAPVITYNLDEVFGSPGWGDAIAIIPMAVYDFYGDKKVIEKNILAAKKWLGYCLSDSVDYIRNYRGYGDWLNFDDDTDKSLLGTLFMGYSAKIIANSCKLIGDRDADYYDALFENIRKAFLRKFSDENSKTASNSQTSYILAYAFGFMTAEQVKPHLIDKFKKSDYRLTCGFLGIKFLLPVLFELKLDDLAYKLLTSTDYPSWCYPVVNGATTIWERWNSYSIENGFGDKKMNSFNHYSFGSCFFAVYKYVLGIKVEGGKISLYPRPDFSGKIDFAQGTYAVGDKYLNVSWKKIDQNTVEYSFDTNFDVDCKYLTNHFQNHLDKNKKVFLIKKHEDKS